MAKITEVTKTVTAKQWAKFIPVEQLADNLIKTAGVLMELPPHVRGKIHMTMQIATEHQNGSLEPRAATKHPQRSEQRRPPRAQR